MIQQQFPSGWDEDRVKRLIEEYENLSEEEQVADDERMAALITSGVSSVARRWQNDVGRTMTDL